jgi:hypothetical protein
LTIFVRPVAARASRIALIVASVPLLTNRIISTDGSAPVIISASRTSASQHAPKLSPLPAAARTASTTAGCACPTIAGPHDPTRSMYRRPSTSKT